ncbi:LANO_0H12860g1_1 [Lachancea nothofagi CBS 11611]|uniref:LANO_0H12860g1_1 n=1 Tax=Lachancea nothofagi CBS 11611 TaxID=1266666 RepID=A0A1G4KME8_9SACH|nr:LANO_0H12860g1_1 [Lachancea nothofagi CBS 11611]
MSSVKDQFRYLVSQSETQIGSSKLRQDSKKFQDLLIHNIAQFLELKTVVYSRLALFSDNESLEDLSTASMPLLSIDFHLAWLISRKQAVQLQDSKDRNVVRLKFLRKAVQVYMQFLVSLQNYEILETGFAKKLDRIENVYEPKLEELYSQPSDAKDLTSAHLKRQQKIEVYQQNKENEAQIKLLDLKYNENSSNDEVLRDLQKAQLRQTAYRAINEIEQVLYEIELLSNFVASPETPPNFEANLESKDPLAYTEKVEALNTPLISKAGKVLRNFTLVDNKSRMKQKVFGYGQYGPTMSVEEFLENEFESGRVLQGGEEPTPEQDEDNEEWQDRETYKAREWDEFKEANARGSGNTLNRG